MKQQLMIVTLVILLTGIQFPNGYRGGHGGGCFGQYVNTFPAENISEEERASLTLMREEEKLARDVYTYLYQLWGIRAFDNISQSEQRHMDSIGTILGKYDIPDPVQSDEQGVFTSPQLTELYKELTARGERSLVDALLVGATIEDLDIFDLQNAMLKADNLDILFVFGNLKKGSENHIRAFVSLLKRNSVGYTAQYISQEELDGILSVTGNGNGWGRGH